MKPIYFHSGMAGAPQYANANGSTNAIVEACLCNGFNIKTATSASASGGVLTLNFATNPGFEALQTVELAECSTALVNGVHRVITNAGNQVTIAIDGLADGAVGSSGAGITIKQASAGWSKPFSSATVSVFRPPAGNRRYLRWEQSVGVLSRVRGYEDMTDENTGTNPFPTVAQATNNDWTTSLSATNANWVLIATDKWMYFCLGSSPSSTYTLGHVFFGDLADVVVPNDQFATLIYTNVGSWMPRDYAGTVGAVPVSNYGGVTSSLWPNPISEGLRFFPNVIIAQNTSSVFRGVIPNFYKNSNPPLVSSYLMNSFENVAGVVGRMKPVSVNHNFGTNGLYAAFAIDEEAWA